MMKRDVFPKKHVHIVLGFPCPVAVGHCLPGQHPYSRKTLVANALTLSEAGRQARDIKYVTAMHTPCKSLQCIHDIRRHSIVHHGSSRLTTMIHPADGG